MIIKNKTSICEGDFVTITYVISAAKKRIQTFSGYCISMKKKINGDIIHLRNNSSKDSVDILFPIETPAIVNITVTYPGKLSLKKHYNLQ